MRQLNPKLKKYIEAKLTGNGLFHEAKKNKDFRVIMWLCATSLVGVKEKTGKNDGEMVNLIQDTVGGMEQWPWCMSAVQTCIAFAEEMTGMKSPIPAEEHCVTVWNQTPKKYRVKNIPLMGAIAIWQDVGKQSGHTEIVGSSDGKTFNAVGGNTSGTLNPKDAVNRDGNGMYFTKRSHSSTAKRKLLGFLKPI